MTQCSICTRAVLKKKMKGFCCIDESYLTNGYLDTPVDWVPGFKDIRLKDLPSFMRTTDRDDIMFNFELGVAEKAKEGFAIILNTFDALEDEAINAVRSELPPIYTIGSLSLLAKHFSEKGLNSIGSNLWKEDSDCIRWLDTKEPNSVVYVNFGSITTITPQQMTEFAWGLANSNQKFLWIIRPGLVSGDMSILPPEFVVEIKERGLLASWCSQEQVLNHPSVGGFLTHSGWNSTIESICSGGPMICWPFFAEQQTNCRYCCIHWGIGMEIDSDVKREEVESAVREMLQGKKGKEMKINAVEWKKKAEKAVSLSGSANHICMAIGSAIYLDRQLDRQIMFERQLDWQFIWIGNASGIYGSAMLAAFVNVQIGKKTIEAQMGLAVHVDVCSKRLIEVAVTRLGYTNSAETRSLFTLLGSGQTILYGPYITPLL
ncbi:hypothetical protein IFM89_015818 [Coptis chinensis]|uniref:Glycosyltransferase n=1 Tax=Coptis chinensis TaxID=261450 RepID=A0A835MEN2_9MAGN|nr:hypothetical protein IFM89_015818 [Coptis chinensis]